MLLIIFNIENDKTFLLLKRLRFFKRVVSGVENIFRFADLLEETKNLIAGYNHSQGLVQKNKFIYLKSVILLQSKIAGKR